MSTRCHNHPISPLTADEMIDALNRLDELPDLLGHIPTLIMDLLEQMLDHADGRLVYMWLIAVPHMDADGQREPMERLGSVIRHPAFKPQSIGSEQ